MTQFTPKEKIEEQKEIAESVKELLLLRFGRIPLLLFIHTAVRAMFPTVSALKGCSVKWAFK